MILTNVVEPNKEEPNSFSLFFPHFDTASTVNNGAATKLSSTSIPKEAAPSSANVDNKIVDKVPLELLWRSFLQNFGLALSV